MSLTLMEGGAPPCAAPVRGTYAHSALAPLERGALAHPGRVAAADEHGSCTYGELFERCRRVGSSLVAAGAGGRPVVVLMEKGVPALVAIFGALAAGSPYVPVDPTVPAGRVAGIVAELDGATVVTDRPGDLPREVRDAARVLDAAELERGEANDAALLAVARSVVDTDLAYVLFTSGSTGAPKGVAVSHRALLDFAGSFVGTLGIRPDDVLGNQAPLDFDVSVKDVYGALSAGASVYLIPRRLFSSPAALVDELAVRGVTVMVWAVAALCLVSALRGLERASLPRVRAVMFSGEVMPHEHLRRWRAALPGATFVNLYGPTEVTCNCLYHVLDPGRDYEGGIPLGEPLPNRRVVVISPDGRGACGPGEVGELYVGGSGIASGYYGDPARTEASFVRSPLRGDVPETLYRTGDLVRVDEAGELFFLGRADNQVKHLGHRVELEEIDAAFERQPGVERCRCAYEARAHRICAFFEGSAEPAALRAAVARLLPAPVVPSSIERVDAMPINKNGKVDRAALLCRHGRGARTSGGEARDERR